MKKLTVSMIQKIYESKGYKTILRTPAFTDRATLVLLVFKSDGEKVANLYFKNYYEVRDMRVTEFIKTK